MSSIFINISDAASFIGQNKWSIIESFERLWKKYDKEYVSCVNELNNKIASKKAEVVLIEDQKRLVATRLQEKSITKTQYTKTVNELNSKQNVIENVITDVKQQVESITLTQTQKIEKELGDSITKTIASSSKETNDKKKITKAAIDTLVKSGQIKEDQKQQLLKHTESLINKTHGVLKEDSAVKIFEDTYHITLDTSQKFYKTHLCKLGEHDWYVGGKMDGIYEDSVDRSDDYVVEVKNRVKGFFYSIREYELTQIQLYLLLTNFQKAKLVEKYNAKIRVTEIERDNSYINDVIEYLNIFIKQFSKFLSNTQMKMSYISSDENGKQMFLKQLYLTEISTLRRYKENLKIIEAQADQDCLIDDLDDF